MENRKIPFGKVKHDLWKNFQAKICLHPEAPEKCEGVICKAHTISRSSTLKKITNTNNQAFSFFPLEIVSKGITIHKKGWKKEATVFLGFCQTHDDQTFSKIEKEDFLGSDEQCFLIGYRALCHEYYMKMASVNSGETLREHYKRNRDAVDIYFLEHQNKEVEEGYGFVKAIKCIYDKALIAGDYQSFNYLSISFTGSLSVVSTGMMTPDYSLTGKQLQDYFNFFGENLFFGFISNGGQNYVVFHWPKKYTKVTNYIESILTLNKSELPNFIVQFIFRYVENTYFSEKWWNSLSNEDKNFIVSLASDMQQYGYPLKVENRNLVNWQNIKIKKHFSYP